MRHAISPFAGRAVAVGLALALALVTAPGWEAGATGWHRAVLRTANADVLRLVNAERVRAQCRGVVKHGALRRAAQRHSARMAHAHVLSHTRAGDSGPGRRVAAEGYRFRRVGENLARGQWNAAEVVRAWMRSPEHRATLTNCAYRHAGVGVSSGRGGPWWTLLLASKRK
ncbi:CAP domain-containing protein [Streptomyces oryzae]|uniref:CAP domain-containing protein n=1 Tax=Streptomyces oryzae TaxID=1434886 RepID=A0ABS3XI58_9ACTN|nr:CAP domain-containing protein [Streptomyces oryzae]MBO8195095.1 CAP domain-containing protein [Streptomyces oryzae]